MNDYELMESILKEIETPEGRTLSIRRFSAMKKQLKNNGVVTELTDLTWSKYIEKLKSELKNKPI